MSSGRMLISMLLLVSTAGCESQTRPLRYTNPLIADAKQGQDCRHQVFGVGGMADVTGRKAMRQGGITQLRSVEYQVNTVQGVGRECVIAHGE